jgi:hypothetical protein
MGPMGGNRAGQATRYEPAGSAYTVPLSLPMYTVPAAAAKRMTPALVS